MDDYFSNNPFNSAILNTGSTVWSKNLWGNLTVDGNISPIHHPYEDLLLEKAKLEETKLSVELLILKSFDKISSIEMLNLIKMLKSSDPENHILAKAIIEKFNKELFA